MRLRNAWIPAVALSAIALVAVAGCVQLAALGGLDQDAPWSDRQFTAGPYLLYRSDGRFAVVVEQELERPPLVEWWPVGAPLKGGEPPRRQLRAEGADGLWVAVLDRVPPGRRIAYRVRSHRGDSETITFKAGTRPGAPFTFAMFGDTRTNHLVHWEVVSAIVRERVDFAIHTGDLVEFGVLRKEWERFLAIERPLMQSRPLFAAMGNHDVSTRGYFERYMVTPQRPDGRRYYFRDWGNVRVVIFDTETEYRAGSAQHRFVAAALEQASRRDMYIVLAIHEPPYSSGSHGSNYRVRRMIRALVRRHGVEIVVAGHDHNYERTKLIDGAHYIVSGSAGAPIRPVEPRSFTAAFRLEPHYVLVDVGPTELIVRAINLDGVTFDTAIIKPNPPAPGTA